MTDKLKMVEKDGKKVPFYAADGVGKMQRGGMTERQAGPRRGRGSRGGPSVESVNDGSLQAYQATLLGGGKGRGAGGLGGLLGGDAESLNRRARKQMQSQAGGPMVTQAGAGRGRMARQAAGGGAGGMGGGLPTIGRREAEAGAPMQRQFEAQSRAQKRAGRGRGRGSFFGLQKGQSGRGGIFGAGRSRGLPSRQRAMMRGIGELGPIGMREGGITKIATETTKAKTRKMERRGYGAARKP